MKNFRWLLLTAATVTLADSAAADAQGLETLGNRASALAAFVAVADDAAAVAWNPAGLVSGPFFNVSVDLGRFRREPTDPPVPGGGAGQIGTTLVAIGTTPLGLAYYRIATTAVEASPAVVGMPDRQDRQVVVRTLATHHLGATVQQSLGDRVTIGATVKLVRGQAGADSGSVSSGDSAFDVADSVEREGSTRGDVDLGAMAWAGHMRLGVVVRNVTKPTFRGATEDVSLTVSRHARVGAAWGDRWPGTAQTIVAVDADLTRVPHGDGERRDVAVGAERWLRERQIGVRAGLRASTIGDARPVVTGGASYAVRAGTYVDAYVAGGAAGARGWGVAARFTY